MPHKCARCKKIYDDNAPELLNGCGCGSRVSEGKSEEETLQELRRQELDQEDIEWINHNLGEELEREDRTIRLDIENLLRLAKGKYRLNLSSLMKGDPLVFKARDGVYYIDIPYSMKKKK